MLFEICIDSVEGALAAQAAGAQRVELCDNLVEGGTTPSIGMLEIVRKSVTIAVNVLIRPRGGDFCYTDLELEVMRRDILAAKQAGADGVVLGVLQPDGRVDEERTRALAAAARPLSVTFHRAFDLCRDPSEALESLCGLGIDRLLTSGQKNSALEGVACIASLVKQSAGRIVILAGGGVNAQSLPVLLAGSGVGEVHFSARKVVESPMLYRTPGIFMGKAYHPEEYIRKQTDAGLIRQVMEAAQSTSGS